MAAAVEVVELVGVETEVAVGRNVENDDARGGAPKEKDRGTAVRTLGGPGAHAERHCGYRGKVTPVTSRPRTVQPASAGRRMAWAVDPARAAPYYSTASLRERRWLAVGMPRRADGPPVPCDQTILTLQRSGIGCHLLSNESSHQTIVAKTASRSFSRT